MERVGLVSRVEEDLERAIVLGLLPGDGFLPSEQMLARQQGVSRATAREALLRLAARGLVVQHPGRRSRAVPLSEAVTLENLNVMLHGEERAHPDRLRLLDGYFSLKRDTMVELLAACCEHASQEELSQLEGACFALQGTAPWEEQRRWAEREFELLRLAAVVANRPGQLLLVRSLERAFWRMAGRLLAHLDCQAVREWAWAAYHALGERDVQALRRKLPSLLQAADAPLIGNLAPAQGRSDLLQPSLTPGEPLQLPGAISPNGSACHTGSSQNPSASHTGLYQTLPAEVPSQEPEVGGLGAVWPNRSACLTSSCHVPPTDVPSLASEAGTPGAVSPNRSASHTGSCQVPPAGASSLAPEEGERSTMEPNRSACLTGSWQSPRARDASHETGGSGAGSSLGRTVFRAARPPDRSAVEGAHVWSPAPWALKSAPTWHGPYFDDTQGRTPPLRVTAGGSQECCTAAELHHAEKVRAASWSAVIELRWG
jgi:DNA-binding FadR family transcriptional regulator